MASSDKTVSEIVDNVNAEDANEESGDPESIEQARPTAGMQFIPQPASIASAIRYAPTVAKRREEAQIPPQLTVAELVGREIVIVDKLKQKAALPDTGELREGYQCLGAFTDTSAPFTVWIGQVALLRDLHGVMLPFKATIGKRGRTYQFS